MMLYFGLCLLEETSVFLAKAKYFVYNYFICVSNVYEKANS